jgi:flagellar protein FlaG
MASVSISHLILFIASMAIAAAVAGTLVQGVGDISRSIDERSLDVSDEIETDIEIISDPGSPIYNRSGNENVTLLVKNTGAKQLPTDTDRTETILDGQFRVNVTITVIGGEQWDAEDVARINISAPGLGSGDHRVRLVVNGDEEVFQFRT